MSRPHTSFIVLVFALVTVLVAPLSAHQMTFKGTVAGLEPARIQVNTGEERKGEQPAWYDIGSKTKVMRGKDVVTIADAKIMVGERVVVLVDHGADGKKQTLEIRLAAR